MRAGYDIDGVLASFGEYFLEYLNIEDKSPFTTWDDYRITEHFHKLTFDYKFWLTMPKLIEAEDLPYEPYMYVTARPIPSRITAQWLKFNNFPTAKVITVGVNGSKVDTLKAHNIDIFFDDAEHNFKELNEAGINCYLITRTHNKNVQTDKRIDDLKNFKIDE